MFVEGHGLSREGLLVSLRRIQDAAEIPKSDKRVGQRNLASCPAVHLAVSSGIEPKKRNGAGGSNSFDCSSRHERAKGGVVCYETGVTGLLEFCEHETLAPLLPGPSCQYEAARLLFVFTATAPAGYQLPYRTLCNKRARERHWTVFLNHMNPMWSAPVSAEYPGAILVEFGGFWESPEPHLLRAGGSQLSSFVNSRHLVIIHCFLQAPCHGLSVRLSPN